MGAIINEGTGLAHKLQQPSLLQQLPPLESPGRNPQPPEARRGRRGLGGPLPASRRSQTPHIGSRIDGQRLAGPSCNNCDIDKREPSSSPCSFSFLSFFLVSSDCAGDGLRTMSCLKVTTCFIYICRPCFSDSRAWRPLLRRRQHRDALETDPRNLRTAALPAPLSRIAATAG